MSETVYFCQIPPFGRYIMSTSGKYGPIGVEQDGSYKNDVLCLSSTTLFLVLFKYFSVIIKIVEMFFVVLNITAC